MSDHELKKKLDEYYEMVMSQLQEIITVQKNISNEQKELKENIHEIKIKIESFNEKSVPLTHKNPILTINDNNKTFGNKATELITNQKSIIAKELTVPETPSQTVSKLKDYIETQDTFFNVKFLNAFIKSTKEIIKINSKSEPIFLKPIDTKIELPIYICGKMNLLREKDSGSMAICFEKASAHAITRAIFAQSENTEIAESDIKDVTSELCNQICGKSKISLKKEGYDFEIDIPQIYQGTHQEINAKYGYPKVVLYFEFMKNPFYVYFWG